MGKSELRNVERRQASAAHEEFEILSFEFLGKSFSSSDDRCMGKQFFTRPEEENDFEINLITIRVVRKSEEWPARRSGCHGSGCRSSSNVKREDSGCDNCVILVIFSLSIHSASNRSIAHKAWEKNNKKSISNYALMFLSLVYMNSSFFSFVFICFNL